MQINTLAQEDPKKCINRVKNSLPALPSAFITRNDEFSLYKAPIFFEAVSAIEIFKSPNWI